MIDSSDFRDTSKKVSDMLGETIDRIRGRSVTLRELIAAIGEQGLLLLCALLCLPFLIPVSVPGVSTVFGGAIILIGVAVTLNRMPWLPKKILDKEMDTDKLIPALQKGVKLVSRIDPYVKPRLTGLTQTGLMARFNGLVLIFSAALLMAPLGPIPFSNTLPGVAILLLAIGMVQRDGVFVLLGYLFNLATVVYFAVLAWLAFVAGQGISSLLGG